MNPAPGYDITQHTVVLYFDLAQQQSQSNLLHRPRGKSQFVALGSFSCLGRRKSFRPSPLCHRASYRKSQPHLQLSGEFVTDLPIIGLIISSNTSEVLKFTREIGLLVIVYMDEYLLYTGD